MSSYKEVEGCLIEKSLNGEFDVIAHGCNCFNLQGAGIAAQMSKIFETNTFLMEKDGKGSINKLGTIDYEIFLIDHYGNSELANCTLEEYEEGDLIVVNAYTQYRPGANLDYEALTLCLRKMNHIFKGKYIGLPKIGAGIAGGDWNFIKTIIQTTLVDCSVTIVNFKK